MSDQNSSTEWPIRVGGEYASTNGSGIFRRVTFFDAKKVWSERFHGNGNPCTPNSIDNGMRIDTFRQCYKPEDQSPIPALVAALKACQLQLLQSNNNSEYAEEANDMAVAALTLAGESSGEEVADASM